MTVIERFKREYQDYNSLTEGRRYEQLREMNAFSSFSGKNLIDCTAKDFRDWLQALHQSGLAPTTVRKNGKMVRPFFGWAFDNGLYSSDDLMALKRAPFPECKKRVPRPYSRKEVKKLWLAIDQAHPLDEDGHWLKRFRRGTSGYKRIEHHAQNLQLTAVVRIALDCGLRRQEIYDLDLVDMHYDNAYIVVRRGKGGKFREVPYTKAARAAVRDWIEFRTRLKPEHERPWLSLTRIGPPGVWLRPMSFGRFSGYVLDAGDWQLHRLRHTCATNWLRAGMPVDKLSRFLGHSDISQTMGYAELVRDDIQKHVERYEDAFEGQAE